MKVTDFIKEFELCETDEAKRKCASIRIVKTYIPYLEKLSVCHTVIEKTMYKKIEFKGKEKTIFCKNTPFQYYLFILLLINKYTDLEINFEHGIETYDMLNEKDLINGILSYIPKNEYEEFNNLLNMCVDDELTNTRDLTSWLDIRFDNNDFQTELLK